MSPRRQAPHRGAADRLPGGARPAPVVGYRFWRPEPGEGGAVLRSVFSAQAWDAGATRARCPRLPPWPVAGVLIPSPSCDCGLYAFRSRADMVRAATSAMRAVLAERSPIAEGAVVGWGPIVQHGCEGWRAAFARPVALLDTGHPLLEAAARRYRVPLLSEPGLQLLAREHGDELAVP